MVFLLVWEKLCIQIICTLCILYGFCSRHVLSFGSTITDIIRINFILFEDSLLHIY